MSIVKWKGYILYDSKNMTFWKGWKSWYSKMIHFQGLRVGGELKRQIKKDFLSNEKYSVTLQWWIHVIIHMPRPTESVQSLSHVHLFENPWTAARQASLSIINSRIQQVSDAIQPSHSLLSPSPPAANTSQHQSLFQWVNSSHEVAKVLEFQL